MNVGKTIQIFLPDGNPRSIKIAEITSRTVQAILIPRSKLDFIFSRDELSNVGVYFLVGNPEEEAKPQLYVGEVEDTKKRIKQHHNSKDFWNYAIVIISKTQYFTKTPSKLRKRINLIIYFSFHFIQSFSVFIFPLSPTIRASC